MPKAELTQVVWPKCQRLADQFGFELVDVTLDKENTGKYLRIYIDRSEGMDLDNCEKFHRAIQPLVEDYDYDFLEVSSPGIDRPLKRDRDYERALGSEIEVHLFKAVDGAKEFSGILAGYDESTFTLETPDGDRLFDRKACSLVKPIVDMTGVEEIDLSDPAEDAGDGMNETEAEA
ncbi:MAG: ribosome maturation factor RimP [Clostridia bacterium]|nr:ribosome maturation factor RimP [Clostridia bacterium]MBR2287381.1 ribosome maturation factor RimP [Clostridia bacterium]